MTTSCKNINAVFDIVYANGGARVFSGSIYLTNFNITFGIGQSSSTLDLEIVVDPCGQGYSIPDVGRAVIFRCTSSGFAFGGIINSATYSESANGFIYKFKIIDPRKILDNVSVLLKDYYCNDALFATLPNFINFAYAQEGIACAVCPPGPDSENWPRVQTCTGFGTSGPGTYSSQNGISLLKVLQRLQINSAGRIFTTSGVDNLNLDVSRLIAVTPTWSVTSNSSMSIGAIIDQAAEDAACDIFTTLEGNTITVWTIDRSSPLTASPISYLISQAKSTGTLINSDEGMVELYEVSNRIVIGDKVNYLAECRTNKPDMMLGYLEDGTVVRAAGTNFTNVRINTAAINSLVGGGLGDSFPISEAEIIAAKKQEMWLLWGATCAPNSLSKKLQDLLGINALLGEMIAAFNQVANADRNIWVRALHDLKSLNEIAARERNLLKFIECHKWFTSFIQEYYGKKWFMPINKFCVYPAPAPDIIQGDGGPYLLSDSPTNDGYPSPTQINRGQVLALDLGDASLLFESSDGKYNGFVRFENLQKTNITIKAGRNISCEINKAYLNPQNYIDNGVWLYVRATCDGEIHNYKGQYQVIVSTDMLPMTYEPAPINSLVTAGVRAMCALFGADKFNNLNNNVNGFNPIQSLNIFNLTPAAGRPDGACIPMRSNIYVYGPWASAKNAIGSTEVLVESSLNPWNFGGYGLMDTAGQAISEQAIRLTNKEYAGSVTLAEPPGWNVQYFIQNYAVVLDSINVVFGSQGVMSTYSFKTYTPRFGQWGKAIAGSLQQMNKDRSNSIARFRELRRKSINERNGVWDNLAKAELEKNPFKREDQNNKVAAGGSPAIFFMGGYIDNATANNANGGQGTFEAIPTTESLDCTELSNYDQKSYTPGSEPANGGATVARPYLAGLYPAGDVDKSYNDAAFWNQGILSLDGLFSPVSLGGRHNKLSKYSEYGAWEPVTTVPPGTPVVPVPPTATINKIPFHRSRPVMPPITKDKLTINQNYINPIVSSTILKEWDSRKGTSTKGFSIAYIGYGDSIGEIFGSDTLRQQKTDFGFFSLRGPLVLQSWGYDTEGKPIPNIIDSPSKAEVGKFQRLGTKNKFMTDWLSNPKTWPVGPIDLRWDRDRGVWVCPPVERIIVAQLIDDLDSYGSAKAILLNPSADSKLYYDDYGIFGDNGENLGKSLKSVQITLYDYLGRKLCKGSRVYAYYEDKRYIVLESSIVKSTGVNGKDSCCEESSGCPDDDCGLSSCFSSLGDGPGVIGLNENNCLTLFPFTDCEDESSAPPSTSSSSSSSS
jgi:hypothetical protein